ncbi:MAG TPA: hypothetical protein VMT85_04015, partial [Thermoanaerobaculia bacterium]|nr:hypothetical protein [Thermoanaerobaculia bacterium]
MEPQRKGTTSLRLIAAMTLAASLAFGCAPEAEDEPIDLDEEAEAGAAEADESGAGGLGDEPGTLTTMGGARLATAQREPYGAYLTTGDGRALYMFTADSAGESNCYDVCAEAWPPLLSDGEPQVPAGLRQELLGTLQRRDGSTQVTYGGWPLYTYAQDAGPDSIEGQDVHGSGGEWYL